MTMAARTWKSGARSRWRGARTKLVPRWTPQPDPTPRTAAEALRDVLLEPPNHERRTQTVK